MQKDDVLRLLRDPNLVPSERHTLLSDIAAQAASLGFPCYVVGGFVRDLLLGKQVKDLDVIVEGEAVKLGRLLVKKIGGKLTPHDAFHTAIWYLPDSKGFVDLITARKETYEKPGALPSVTQSTMDDDLRRRDFTINAMAIRLDGNHFGELLDPLNGRGDLEKGIIRVLHPRSFVDDPTRMFRAIRYEKRYSFNLETSTRTLINPGSLAVLSTLSGERIRNEFDLTFEEENASKIILRIVDLGILSAVHPALPPFNERYAGFLDMDLTLDVPANRPSLGYMLWLMDLPEDEILSIARRLDFTSDLTHSVWAVSQLKKSYPFLVNSKPSVWTFALERLPLLSIYVVYLVTGENALLSYLSMWRHVKPRTTGDDLKACGLEPGPRYGEILSQLRAAWLDGEISNKEEEEKYLKSILQM